MRWTNIRLIFTREVRDQLRDRRTLFMVAVLPLLLYPGLGIGMAQMMLLFREQPRTVVILGADDLPDNPPLLVGDRIYSKWFESPDDAARLIVITDHTPPPHSDAPISGCNECAADSPPPSANSPPREQGCMQCSPESDATLPATTASGAGRSTPPNTAPPPARPPGAEALLAAARDIRRQLLQRDRLDQQLAAETHPARREALTAEINRLDARLSDLFTRSHVDVLIVVPEGFRQALASIDRQLQAGPPSRSRLPGGTEAATDEASETSPARQAEPAQAAIEFRPLRPVRNRASEKSLMAYHRVKDALDAWWDEVREERFSQAGLPRQFAAPISNDPIDVARDEQISASVWSKLFPALLVMMALTGAFYPSIDMAAGEKERGTMETLLISPARRSEIVLGKFLTIVAFSISTALLNLASMGLTGKYMATVAGASSIDRLGNLHPPGLGSLAWVIVLLLPLAALFSALCLALATFARSSKEGQYYLTPLLMVTMGITIFCVSPGVEIDPFKSIVPVMGPALLLREVLSAPGDARPLVYAIPVLVTSLGYCALALWWAIEQFSREEVLFREAERFDLRLWLRHLLRDKEATPSFTEAGFCFVLIMLLQFGTMSFFQGETRLLRVLMIQQIALIASPALMMGVMLTTNVVRTFRLRWPAWQFLAVALVLPFALHPLSVELLGLLTRLEWLPPLPEWITRVVSRLGDPAVPLWQILLAMAVVPAVCEELAFRGFILSGFSRSGRTGLAVVLSAVLFGLMHQIPQQVFNAALLGLVLGLLAIRSGSLLPAIVFHVTYNSLEVLRSRLDATALTREPLHWFFRTESGAVGYAWPTLLICAAAAALVLRWLVNRRNEPTDNVPAIGAGHDSRDPDPPSPLVQPEPAFADDPAVPMR